MLVVVALRGALTEFQGIVACSVLESAALLAAVHPGRSPVVVLGEQRDKGALRSQATLLADRDGGRPVAVRAWTHSPLAILALATWIHEQSFVDDGQAMAALDLAAAHTLSSAWVRRVGGLESPEPTLGQHLRSWSPAASGFLVLHNPHERVYALGNAPDSLDWVDGLAAPRSTLFVSGEAPSAAVAWAQRLAGVAGIVQVPAFTHPSERYGSDRAVELCALPTDPLAMLADLPAGGRCCVCALLTPLGVCAFCKRTCAPITLEGAA